MGVHNAYPDTAAIGGVFVEIIFSMLVYGFTLAQTMYYLWNYPGDGLVLKALVLVLWALDTARAVLVVDHEWWYLVKNHANVASLEESQGRATIPHCIISVLVIFVVQSFFIHNIWKLMAQKGGRVVMTSVAIAFATLSAVAGLAFVYQSNVDENVSRLLSDIIPAGSVQAVSALFTDLYITLSLCIILRAAKTHKADGAQAVLSTLLVYTVNRGLLIVIVQFVQFVSYVPQWHDAHMVVDMFHLHEPSCTVYVNALLAVLNVRRRLRAKRQAVSMLWEKPPGLSVEDLLRDSDSGTVAPGDTVGSPSSSFFSLLGSKRRPVSVGVIDILVTKEVVVDGPPGAGDSGAQAARDGADYVPSVRGHTRLSRSWTV